MKSKWLALVLSFIASIHLMATVQTIQDVSFTRVEEMEDFQVIDVKQVVKRYVPQEYQEAFFKMTYDENDVVYSNNMLVILAIGYHETGWKDVVGTRNKNKTKDYGFMQLNEANIKNDWFMEKFGPNENDRYQLHGDDKTELYLVTCIKFYLALQNLYGDDAAYAYNAGETRYVKYSKGKGKLPPSTLAYKNKVSSYTKQFYDESIVARQERFEENARRRQRLLEGKAVFADCFHDIDYGVVPYFTQLLQYCPNGQIEEHLIFDRSIDDLYDRRAVLLLGYIIGVPYEMHGGIIPPHMTATI